MQRTYVRRRRRLAAALLLLAMLAVGSPVAGAVSGSGGTGADPSAIHVVEVGDTLWSIATGHDPSRDPRAVVHEIAELNALGDGPLIPGRTLQLPPTG